MDLKSIKSPLHINSSFLLVSIIVQSLLGFAFWGLATRFFSEEIIGYSSAIISAATYLTILGLMGMNFSIVYFLPKSKNPNNLINTSLTVPILISISIAGVFLLGIKTFSPALSFITSNTPFTICFIGLVALSTLYAQLQGVFVAKRQTKYAFFKSIIFTGLRIPLLYVIAHLGLSSLGIVLNWTLSVLIAVAICLIIFLPKIQSSYKVLPNIDKKELKGTWKYNWASYTSNLMAFAPVYILPMLVVNLKGPEENAYFYITWMVATILFGISASASQSLFAESIADSKALISNVRKTAKYIALLTTIGLVILFLGGQKILAIFGESYVINSLSLLKILAVSSIPVGVVYIYTSILRVTNRMKELIIVWTALAIGILVSSFKLLPIYGIQGIGYAWIASYSALAIYSIISMKKRYERVIMVISVP